MDGVFSKKIKIFATDVDFQNRWKLQSLLCYAQEAANSQCEECGAGRDHLNDLYGAAFILARNYVEIYRYPKSSEKVEISTWPKAGSRHILTRFFEFKDADGVIIARIVSHWAVMSLKERKLISPDTCKIAMPDTSNVDDILEMPKRVPFPTDIAEEKTEIMSKYSDIDCLGHVNNTKYAEWVCDFLGHEFFTTREIASLDIKYCREVKCDEKITLVKCSSNGHIFVKGIGEKDGAVCFECVLGIRKR